LWKFRESLKKIARKNPLPDYSLQYQPDADQAIFSPR
jgi:hypothetical protein